MIKDKMIFKLLRICKIKYHCIIPLVVAYLSVSFQQLVRIILLDSILEDKVLPGHLVEVELQLNLVLGFHIINIHRS